MEGDSEEMIRESMAPVRQAAIGPMPVSYTHLAGVRRQAREWPKRARTAAWESGVLTLDGEKQFEIPELTMNLIERLQNFLTVLYKYFI